MDDYQQAALRWFWDAEHLYSAQRYGGASHAYGLAAECALKYAMESLPGGDRELPRRHLPDLINDARRWFSGRTRRGLYQLLNMRGYMANWVIDNRYWADSAFGVEDAERYRNDSRRTCIAAGLSA